MFLLVLAAQGYRDKSITASRAELTSTNHIPSRGQSQLCSRTDPAGTYSTFGHRKAHTRHIGLIMESCSNSTSSKELWRYLLASSQHCNTGTSD